MAGQLCEFAAAVVRENRRASAGSVKELDAAVAAHGPDAQRLYRLWWDLCEISLYVAEFRRPHRDTEDTRVAWRGLTTHLDPSRWAGIL